MSEIIDGKIEGARGARITQRWQPKEWLPIYEAIVALSCTGLSNEAVGARFGYGKQQVSNILNTPQGKKLKEIIAQRIRDSNTATIAERVTALHEKALERVEFVIGNDEFFEKHPLAIFDRSFAVLKSGVLKDQNPVNQFPGIGAGQTTNIEKAVFMTVSPDAAKQMNDGMELANRVKLLHGDSVTKQP